jgi:hypothetical protein
MVKCSVAVPGYASAASTFGKIRKVRSSRVISKIERMVSCRPLRKNLPLVRPMVATVASIILLAPTPTPSPARVTPNDLVGMWITVHGDCREGQHLLSGNGDYRVWCFDGISEGKWFLRGRDKIVVTHDPKKSDEEIITVLRFEPYLITHFFTSVIRMGAERNG